MTDDQFNRDGGRDDLLRVALRSLGHLTAGSGQGEASLREMVEKVEEARDVCGALSHDIKAPLRAVHGFAEALRDSIAGTLGPPDDRYFQHVLQGTDRVLRMLEPLVDFCRLGEDGLRWTRIDLTALIERAGKVARAERQPEVGTIHYGGQCILLRSDPELLSIVVRELLRNALLYVQDGAVAEVRVSTALTIDQLEILVEDKGIGMDMRDADRIFDLFGRLQPDSAYSGVGMGLPMARKAARLLGGTLEISSALGRGTTARVLFPLNDALQRA